MDVVAAIEDGKMIDDIEHPNKAKCPRQRMFVIAFNVYVYVAPYVRTADVIFVKTVFPSRALKARYFPEGRN